MLLPGNPLLPGAAIKEHPVHHPIKRTTVMLLLLGASGILVFQTTAPAPFDQPDQEVRPSAKVPALTALLGTAAPPAADLAPEHGRPAEETIRTPEPARKPRVVPSPQPRTRTVRMRVTAYCPCRKCCGRFSDGVTASGKNVYTNGSKFVAADTRTLRFGTMVSIPGYHGGQPVPVLDRGSKIRGNRMDVFFLSHRRAAKWGTRQLNVTVHLDHKTH